ncbi:zinc finger, CCHC-type containing protein [Tanacetum coccineum]|uniref:Zinc finger, CCHC-type containing protein n=1 Tax=Tanacetum coccineum TaxID=301880 RepID=A0ABQ5CSZ8_9ASTR
MNTRLNIEKLDGNIIQKHGGSKQVGFKQLGPGVETGVHGVHDEKRWSKDGWRTTQPEEKQTGLLGLKKKRSRKRNIRLGGRSRRVMFLIFKNQRSTQQCMKSGVAKHLGVAGIQQQNGLVNKTNVTLFAKVRCFLIQSGLSKVFWAEDTTMSTYLVTRSPLSATGFKTPIICIVGNKLWRLDDVTSKVVLYRNMGFNESGEYKKTFIGSGVGTGSMQVLQGDEFEVEPQDGHTFEGATLSMGTIQYREDSNEAAFAVAAVEKIYAHESLTFNNTVACEVISKWKAGLKDDMDARSDVYVLSNGCKKCSDDSDGYYWESTPGSTSGFTMNSVGKTFCLKGHSILSLEGSLSGDYDVEKNDVGMLIVYRGLQTDVQVFVDFDYAMGRSITSGVYDTYGGCKGRYLAKETRNRVRIRAKDSSRYCYRCLVKGYPVEVQHRLNLLSIGIG